MIPLKSKDYQTGKDTKSTYMLFTRTQLEHNATESLKVNGHKRHVVPVLIKRKLIC